MKTTLTRNKIQLSPLHDASNYINYSRTYTYDKAGNLLTIGHNGANQYTLNMVVSNNSNRTVQQISDNPISADKVDELFDALGNLKQLEHSKALTWGRYNQLEKVALTNKQHEVYQYSAQGTRIRKLLSDDDNESEVIYLPGLELRTKRGSVSEILHVVTLMNTGRSQVRLLHWQEDCLPSDIPNNQLRYSMDNHLGSSNLELNCNADILTMEEYYPFGGTALWSAKNQTEAKYKTIRYSGKERDATGLYYYGYRYYMPWMGRWLNPDPAGTVDGLNLYQMVRNNPVNLKDPTGMLAHTLVSKPIKKLDSYLTKKTTKYLQDKGKSVETIRKWNNARRTVMLGVGIGIAVGSFAAGVGASIGVAVGVGAAGILAGAAIGAFANKISDTAAGHMANNVNGKSVTIQTLAGAAVATLSAATHGASKGGGLLASAGGAASGALMGALDQTERGMAGANAGGSAVGTADTLSGGKARLPVQFGAMTGGIMGGWVLGKTKGSASVGEYAGIGACLGGRMGRYIDRITSLSGLVGEVMRQYSTTGAMAAWELKN
ncbi:RHS repeat-associated core domain-containing protein [Moritella viscosa]